MKKRRKRRTLALKPATWSRNSSNPLRPSTWARSKRKKPQKQLQKVLADIFSRALPKLMWRSTSWVATWRNCSWRRSISTCLTWAAWVSTQPTTWSQSWPTCSKIKPKCTARVVTIWWSSSQSRRKSTDWSWETRWRRLGGLYRKTLLMIITCC